MSSLFLSDLSSLCSLDPQFLLVCLPSLLSSLPPLIFLPPSLLMTQFGLQTMFSLFLSLPALDSSRCLWLFSPSHLQ